VFQGVVLTAHFVRATASIWLEVCTQWANGGIDLLARLRVVGELNSTYMKI
jgi:hypothetical protein